MRFVERNAGKNAYATEAPDSMYCVEVCVVQK